MYLADSDFVFLKLFVQSNKPEEKQRRGELLFCFSSVKATIRWKAKSGRPRTQGQRPDQFTYESTLTFLQLKYHSMQLNPRQVSTRTSKTKRRKETPLEKRSGAPSHTHGKVCQCDCFIKQCCSRMMSSSYPIV